MNRKDSAGRAGSVTSERKAQAARINGALGGRPRKSARVVSEFKLSTDERDLFARRLSEMFEQDHCLQQTLLQLAAVAPDTEVLTFCFKQYCALDNVGAREFAQRAKLSPDRRSALLEQVVR